MVSLDTDGKAIFIVFLGAIIAATLLATIATSTIGETTTITITNASVTSAAVNATLDVRGRQLLTTVAIINTSGTDLTGVGASLQTGTGSNGLLSVQLLLNDTASSHAAKAINISYTANPDGYISDTGGRAITNLIPLFAALAILVFVIVVFIKNGSLGKLMGRS